MGSPRHIQNFILGIVVLGMWSCPKYEVYQQPQRPSGAGGDSLILRRVSRKRQLARFAVAVLAAASVAVCQLQQYGARPPTEQREFRLTGPAAIAMVRRQDPSGRLRGEDLEFLDRFNRLADSLQRQGFFVAVSFRDTIHVIQVDSFRLPPRVIANRFSNVYVFLPGRLVVDLPATWPPSAWSSTLQHLERRPRQVRSVVAVRPSSLTFRTLVLGSEHTCGLVTDGRAYCWGSNDYGQLGNHDTGDTSRPARVAGTLRFVELTAGTVQTCGRTTKGEAACWGAERRPVSEREPHLVAGGLRFADLSSGNAFTCGRTGAGIVYCWGSNAAGQLGNGSGPATSARDLFQRIPIAVAGGLRWSELSTGGGFHSCARTASGEGYCWGVNGRGELGDGTKTNRYVPTRVAGGLRFAQLGALGQGHTCGLLADGRAFCWGENSEGQLGDSTTVDRTTPVPVAGGLRFVELTAGAFHTCGRTRDGRAFCWGGDNNGERGDGVMTSTRITKPVPVAGGLRFTVLRAGGSHTCGLTREGAAFCWGLNDHGELGDGTGSTSMGPVQVVP